jgi:hypothetical protein
VSTLIGELRALSTGAGPQPQDVLLSGQADPDRGVDRAVGDLAVTDLDHDRVDEDRGVDLVQGPGGPGLHLLDHLVGDPADRLLADRGAVDLVEVSRDLTGRQPAGIQRQHDLVDLGETPLTLLHDHRLEGTVAVSGDVELDLTRGVGQHRLRPGPVADVARLPILRGTVLVMS